MVPEGIMSENDGLPADSIITGQDCFPGFIKASEIMSAIASGMRSSFPENVPVTWSELIPLYPRKLPGFLSFGSR
jgi:hypothetical protein